jgi:aliphatic nitrilase
MSQQVRVAAAQAEPCWLDIAAGVDRVVDLIAEAARGGAQLVAFPETFLPGYPWWICPRLSRLGYAVRRPLQRELDDA